MHGELTHRHGLNVPVTLEFCENPPMHISASIDAQWTRRPVAMCRKARRSGSQISRIEGKHA